MGFYSKRHYQQFQAPTPEQEAARLRSLRCQEQAREEAKTACPVPPASSVPLEEFVAAVQAQTAWISRREQQLWVAA